MGATLFPDLLASMNKLPFNTATAIKPPAWERDFSPCPKVADPVEVSEKMIAEINKRSQIFVLDNWSMFSDNAIVSIATIESAMLIGASIALEHQI